MSASEAEKRSDAAKEPVPKIAYLAVLAGQPKALHVIEKERLGIGKQDQNDLVLSGPGISNYHAEILRTPEGWFLKDLGSTNGTFVNGQRQLQKSLANRDKIVLGKVLLRFTYRKPIPPKMFVYTALAAIGIAVLAGDWIAQKLSGGESKAPVLSEEERLAEFLDLMEDGLERYRQQDLDRAEITFLRAKKRYGKSTAPQTMLQLAGIMKKAAGDSARIDWVEVRKVLGDLSKSLPDSESYRRFLNEELASIDDDQACAEHFASYYEEGTSQEKQFDLLETARHKWPASRIYQVFESDLVRLSTELGARYFQDAEKAEAAATALVKEKDIVKDEDIAASGQLFADALRDYRTAKRFDLNNTDRTLDDRIGAVQKNLDAYGALTDASKVADSMDSGAAARALEKLATIGSERAYHALARARTQILEFSKRYQQALDDYRAGEPARSLRALADLMADLSRRKEKQLELLKKSVTTLQGLVTAIPRQAVEMKSAFEARNYRNAIATSAQIRKLEEAAKVQSAYYDQAVSIDAESRQRLSSALGEKLEMLERTLGDTANPVRYKDGRRLIEEAQSFMLDESRDQDDRRLAQVLEREISAATVKALATQLRDIKVNPEGFAVEHRDNVIAGCEIVRDHRRGGLDEKILKNIEDNLNRP